MDNEDNKNEEDPEVALVVNTSYANNNLAAAELNVIPCLSPAASIQFRTAVLSLKQGGAGKKIGGKTSADKRVNYANIMSMMFMQQQAD